MDVYQNGSNILRRWYIGDSYMKEISGGETKEYTFIGGDAYSAPVAGVTQNGVTTYYYLLRDYLGNITHQVSTSNTVVAEYSFDAWGRRRNPASWNYDLSQQPDLFAGRGFTGYEHLPWFNLINMNGRMYDPLVGRFLSPDNFVQSPDYTQSLNRYSYCWNNPLKYTDPDGEWVHILAGAIIGSVLGTLQSNINSIKEGKSFWKAMLDGAIAGHIGGIAGAAAAATGGAVGGSLSFGGFAGGAISGAASGAVGGFIGGAGNAWANGASFGNGLNAGVMDGGIGILSGGVIGGFSRGISDYRRGFSFWRGSKIDEFIVGSAQYESIANRYNTSFQADRNDELLKLFIQDEFGVSEGDFNIQDITTRSGKGFGLTNSGRYINLKSGDMVAGYVEHFSTGYSDFHISPYYTYGDAINFRAVAGHELIHAYHYYALPYVNSIYTERVAYKYTHDVFMNNGRFNSAISTMNTALLKSSGSFWGPFPAQYKVPAIFGF